MNPLTRRIAGYLLLTAAVIGVLISIIGIIFVNSYMSKTRALAIDSADTLYELTQLTDKTLDNVNDSIDKIAMALTSLEGMTQGVADSVKVAVPTLDELSAMVGTDLPKTVDSMQSSLETAAVSAKNIDSILVTISKIPFLGGAVYNPDKPLSDTLLDVSGSLDDLPASLSRMQKGIDEARINLNDANLNMGNVTKSVDAIVTNVDSAKKSIQEYKVLTGKFQARIDEIRQDVPRFLNLFTFVIIGSLVWLLLAQISLFLQGLDLINTKIVNVVEVKDEPPAEETTIFE